MSTEQTTDPLHGITLQTILEALVEEHGWEALSWQIRIRCFANDPSVHSSLKFLRQTPWARAKVEALYLAGLRKIEKNKVRNQKRKARRLKKAAMQAEAVQNDAVPVAEAVAEAAQDGSTPEPDAPVEAAQNDAMPETEAPAEAEKP